MIAQGLAFLVGAGVVYGTLLSAVRTMVVPRSIPVLLTRIVFQGVYQLFRLRMWRAKSYETRDGIMTLFAPISLLMLPVTWLMLVLLGYMGMFWAVGVQPWRTAFLVSGSSLLTLGFAPVETLPQSVLAFTEAIIGLILTALLISYLPTMYAAFSRRETAVAMLEVRAGSPPSAVELIKRSYRLTELAHLTPLWVSWEVWFVEVEESHTSLSALCFFRSPQPDRSWITAAGTILDAAALMSSTVDVPYDMQAALCLRAGYIALQRISDNFDIPYPRKPAPTDPISISRDEFDDACEELVKQGVPVKADREQAWRDYAGWRVNYDTPLLALAALTMAPFAPWSSDRSLRQVRPRTNFLKFKRHLAPALEEIGA